jgi:hypothetical protein
VFRGEQKDHPGGWAWLIPRTAFASAISSLPTESPAAANP